MLVKATAERVAIIGAGCSGAAAAKILKTAPQVSLELFDRGKRPGGRCSTRQDKRHGKNFSFDHGATYIRAKTPEFQSVIDELGLPKWPAKLGSLDYKIKDNSKFSLDETSNDIYCGSNGMDSIPKALMEGCSATFGVTVSLQRDEDDAWQVYNEKNGELLGTFDWIICSERSLSNELLGKEEKYPNVAVPSLVAMLALDKESTEIVTELMPCNGIRILNDNVLTWIAQDSSKPGRHMENGGSTWVLQSTVPFAQRLIEDVRREVLPCSDADLLKAIKSDCENPLYQAFLDIVTAAGGRKEPLDLKPLYLKGHRWGFSFPASLEEGTHYVDKKKRLVACGDYFADTGAPAKVEGAVLSGLAAAKALLSAIDHQCQ